MLIPRMCVALMFLLVVASYPAIAQPPSQEELESSLQIRYTFSKRVLQPWDRCEVSAEIVNTSQTDTLHVVLPGDGSASGRREPKIWIETERLNDGEWIPVHDYGGGWFCGFYDADWISSVRTLKPNQSIAMSGNNFVGGGVRSLATGVYRQRLVYHFRGNIPSRPTQALEPEGYGLMTGYPEHTLRSEPVEFVIPDAPLSIRIDLKDQTSLLSEETLIDSSGIAIWLDNAGDTAIQIQCGSDHDNSSRSLYTALNCTRNKRYLGGGVVMVRVPEAGVITVPAHGSVRLDINDVRDDFKPIDLNARKPGDTDNLVFALKSPDWERVMSSRFQMSSPRKPASMPHFVEPFPAAEALTTDNFDRRTKQPDNTDYAPDLP